MFKTVLIAVDVSEEAETQRIFAAAKALTMGWNCALHVINVVPPMGMAIVGSFLPKNFEARSREAAHVKLMAALADADLKAKTHVLTGKVYDTILTEADALAADLILIGSHQPELQDFLLGANAARIVRHANASVLVLRDYASAAS